MGQEGVKVVYIQTHYIETDPMSFKSVVQSLTGKDSCVSAWTTSENNEQRYVVASGGRKRQRTERSVPKCGEKSSVPILTKETSFDELERFMSELPSMEELLSTADL